jgi:type IV pilus assembly protein PilZ
VRRFKKMIDRISECSYRKDPRLPKTLSLAYKDRQSFVKAYTANVSLGGLFIKTENPLPKEEKFQLKLQLPDIPEPMMIQCQVAWSRRPGGQGEAGPAGMGIMFMEMSPKDDQVFKRYLRELMLKK